MLGIYGPSSEIQGSERKTGRGEDGWIEVCGRGVPVKYTPEGVRAVVKDKPIDPSSVSAYLERAFGGFLGPARSAMAFLAGAYEVEELRSRAYGLYEKFRPAIPPGKRGWGAKGVLDLGVVRSLVG